MPAGADRKLPQLLKQRCRRLHRSRPSRRLHRRALNPGIASRRNAEGVGLPAQEHSRRPLPHSDEYPRSAEPELELLQQPSRQKRQKSLKGRKPVAADHDKLKPRVTHCPNCWLPARAVLVSPNEVRSFLLRDAAPCDPKDIYARDCTRIGGSWCTHASDLIVPSCLARPTFAPGGRSETPEVQIQ